jgi:hypothetical protein
VKFLPFEEAIEEEEETDDDDGINDAEMPVSCRVFVGNPLIFFLLRMDLLLSVAFEDICCSVACDDELLESEVSFAKERLEDSKDGSIPLGAVEDGI